MLPREKYYYACYNTKHKIKRGYSTFWNVLRYFWYQQHFTWHRHWPNANVEVPHDYFSKTRKSSVVRLLEDLESSDIFCMNQKPKSGRRDKSLMYNAAYSDGATKNCSSDRTFCLEINAEVTQKAAEPVLDLVCTAYPWENLIPTSRDKSSDNWIVVSRDSTVSAGDMFSWLTQKQCSAEKFSVAGYKGFKFTFVSHSGWNQEPDTVLSLSL